MQKNKKIIIKLLRDFLNNKVVAIMAITIIFLWICTPQLLSSFVSLGEGLVIFVGAAGAAYALYKEQLKGETLKEEKKGEKKYIVIQFAYDGVKKFEKQTNIETNEVIDIKKIISGKTIQANDWPKIVNKFEEVLDLYQDFEIHLVQEGLPALAFKLGQSAGKYKKVVVHNYNPLTDSYEELPVIKSIDEINSF